MSFSFSFISRIVPETGAYCFPGLLENVEVIQSENRPDQSTVKTLNDVRRSLDALHCANLVCDPEHSIDEAMQQQNKKKKFRM